MSALSVGYGREVGLIMIIYIMAFAYAASSPIILPFTLCYFTAAWVRLPQTSINSLQMLVNLCRLHTASAVSWKDWHPASQSCLQLQYQAPDYIASSTAYLCMAALSVRGCAGDVAVHDPVRDGALLRERRPLVGSGVPERLLVPLHLYLLHRCPHPSLMMHLRTCNSLHMLPESCASLKLGTTRGLWATAGTAYPESCHTQHESASEEYEPILCVENTWSSIGWCR